LIEKLFPMVTALYPSDAASPRISAAARGCVRLDLVAGRAERVARG
jgi:hypothetical protein